MNTVRDALESRGFTVVDADVAMIPQSTVMVEGKEAEQLLRLTDGLEEHDDVSKVFSNFDIDQETLSAVSG